MLQHQRSVDVFHAVKTLRNNKPNMVDLLVRSIEAALLSELVRVYYNPTKYQMVFKGGTQAIYYTSIKFGGVTRD